MLNIIKRKSGKSDQFLTRQQFKKEKKKKKKKKFRVLGLFKVRRTWTPSTKCETSTNLTSQLQHFKAMAMPPHRSGRGTDV